MRSTQFYQNMKSQNTLIWTWWLAIAIHWWSTLYLKIKSQDVTSNTYTFRFSLYLYLTALFFTFFSSELWGRDGRPALWNTPQKWSKLDHNDGQFFRAMEWLMFFLGHHCRQWFFNGFDKVGPSPLNVFLGVQPLEPMVFRWFSKFWGQWSTMVLRLTMVWMTHWA